MRALVRVGGALLLALALSTSAFAQSFDDRISLNANVGPSFANVGTTFAAAGTLDVALNERTSLVGEFGMLRHAAFDDALSLAAPLAVPGVANPRVNGYHWNGNVKFQPFELSRLRPYVTGGLGTFATDMVTKNRVPGTTIEDRRRVTDFSTNVGAGALIPLNDWVGVTADYRTFFVHRDTDTPRVHRFATGVTFTLK
jgi:opacity protein-like surface antigen